MSLMKVVLGDITKIECDAIVNAANEGMLGGGGVDGAIHRAAGPELLAECCKVEEVRPGVRCPTGEVRVTGAGKLPCRHVIHTVGPVWNGGESGESEDLANCYRNSLRVVDWLGLTRIVFPSISTGAYNFPPEEAARIAIREVGTFLRNHKGIVVIFCMFNGPRDTVDMKALYDRIVTEYYEEHYGSEKTDRREDYERSVKNGLVFTYFHGEQDCPYAENSAHYEFWEYEAQLASMKHDAKSIREEADRFVKMWPELGTYFHDDVDVSDVAKAVAIWVGFAHDEDLGFGGFNPGRGFASYFHPADVW